MAQQVLARARVAEKGNFTGTGAAILNGVLDGGYRPFSSIPGLTSGDPLYYLLKAGNGEWEMGTGTYFATPTPRILRSSPIQGSAGDATLVNFTQAPDIYLTASDRAMRTFGSYSMLGMNAGVNQVIAAATDVIINFQSSMIAWKGFGGAASNWNTTNKRQESFNEQGMWNFNCVVHALTTFAGDSYLSIWQDGFEAIRGQTMADAKSLSLNADIWLPNGTDFADVRIRSATGGTIVGSSVRSWLQVKWIHPYMDG